VHNYLTKSRTYQGLNWMWKPDEIIGDAVITNTPYLTRNYIINPQNAANPWYFSACIPLKVIFNFCNDYNKVMWGMKHRIRMTRANSTRALYRSGPAIAATGVFQQLTASPADGVINLTTLRWVMPVVRPSPSHEQALLEIVGNNS